MNHAGFLPLPILLSFWLLAIPLSSTRADGPPTAKLDPGRLTVLKSSMQKFVDQGELAGAVTCVAGKDSVLDLEAFGEADIAQKQPMKTDAIFWIASMTKPITATAIMMLQEEGKLSVDDPVSKYIPELGALKTADGQTPVITLKHLLTHTSGMADIPPEESAHARTLADLIPAFASKPLLYPPGQKWRYCQSGINTLGRVIEVVSGQSYPQFLQQRLFDPLGMKDTTFYLSPEQATRLATSYKRTPDGKLEQASIWILQGHSATDHDRYPAANGGLFSTAPDYARFCQMILNHGTLDGKQYLKPESVAQMTTLQTGDIVTGFTPGNGWGLGWCVVKNPQGVSAALSPGSHGHGGAFGTQVWIDPVKGLIYILMIQRSDLPNSDDSPMRKALQDTAADALVL